MKPPVCAVCELEFDPQLGESLRFKDFSALPETVCGQPNGMEWFCEKHINAAAELRELDLESALSILKDLKNPY